MAKRVRVTSSEEDSKCKVQRVSIDRISKLHDELLVSILSLLPLKEATATSILCRRWRYLWTFLPKLDFDGTESLSKVMKVISDRRASMLDQGRMNYIRWVNHGISLQKDSTIEEFRVAFNLTDIHSNYIDEWVRYALARKVQRLELNLTDQGSRSSREYDECYTFPYNLLRIDEGRFSDFECLKSIRTHYVNVDGEALEFLICNCPLLEELSVSQSGELTTLKITGAFPSFKRLEISLCHDLESVEIRDAGLVYLKYEGPRIPFLLENVPLLVEVYVGGRFTDHMEDVLFMLASHLPQLEKFTIHKMSNFSWEETEMFYSIVKMSNLKQLVVKLWFYYDENTLLPLTNLIRAAPRLQRFVLETLLCSTDFVRRKFDKMVCSSYPQLKDVEFVGYCGARIQLELVMHFLKNAVALENVVVDTWNHYSERTGQHEMARIRARKQLTRKVPPSINLKIL